MSLDPQVVTWIIQAVIILILSICVHEFGHAIVAHKLGDMTPKSQGRVTLNPFAHADPIGTLAFPVIALLATGGKSMGFGWGRPVQVMPVNFTRKLQMRVSHMLVALAGPAMNVLLGTVLIAATAILFKQGVLKLPVTNIAGFDVVSLSHLDRVIQQFGYVPGMPLNVGAALIYASYLNFILFFFNLIPAPPLDGGAVLEGFLPDRMLPGYQRFKVYGPFILLSVILIPGAHKVFTVPAGFVHKLLYGLFL